ncbi:MAG: FAD-binding oxidoreductase, partial [Planctomycetota bacterium]|nr:FAD-binding oxidoreductase [Planctomycetota bacterium]
RIEVEGGRVRGVATGRGGSIPASRVINAAGAWAREVGAAAGAPLPLRPTRRHMLAFARDARAAASPVVWDDIAALYVRARGDRWLVSPCDVEDAAPGAGGGYDVDPEIVERTRDRLTPFAPELADAPLVDVWAGYRDLAPDDRPVLGEDPRVPGLSWCAGFGGHGMTLGLAAGRSAARATLGLEDPWTKHCDPMRLCD